MRNKRSKIYLLLLIFACSMLPLLVSADSSDQDKGKTFPASTVGQHDTGSSKWVGDPISLDVKDLDIRDFFFFIADISKMNVILDPDVKGTVTMKVHDVPWDQLMDLVCRTHGLGYELNGNVVGVEDIRH